MTTQADVRRLSGCDGKARFTTFSAAERTAHRQAQRRKGRFSAYGCNFCGGFHVGTSIGDVVRGFSRFDGRQRYAVYAIDPFGRESLVGFATQTDGGRVSEIVKLQSGWTVSRVVDRMEKAA